MQPETSLRLEGESRTNFRHSPRHTRDLQALLDGYQGKTIETSFRSLVGVLPADDMTHGIFPYPARLLRQIPRMLLSSRQITSGVDYVIDPFCGSGTVLLEAQIRGIPAVGIDQNPVAALVSRAKTTHIDRTEMQACLSKTSRTAKKSRSYNLPADFLSRWYSPATLSALSRLAAAVKQAEDPRHKDFLSLVLILTARSVSIADPRIPVPVRKRPDNVREFRSSDVWSTWENIGEKIMTKIGRLAPGYFAKAYVAHGDARTSEAWSSPLLGRRSLILTSPPYGAAQKYIRSTSLDAGWLGFSARKGTIALERSSVGREHLSTDDRRSNPRDLISTELADKLASLANVNSLRASIYTNYFLDMQKVLKHSAGTEINCQRLVLICGTNSIKGETIDTYEFLSEIAEHYGYRRSLSLRDPIRGRTLLTSRKSKSSPAPAEFVEVFERW